MHPMTGQSGVDNSKDQGVQLKNGLGSSYLIRLEGRGQLMQFIGSCSLQLLGNGNSEPF